MIQQFQSRRSVFFLWCVFLTVLMIFCYSFSNELTSNLIQPYLQKQIQNLDEGPQQELTVHHPDEKAISTPPHTPTNPSIENQKPIKNIPKLPYLGKVNEIYPPGFSYSPTTICENNGSDLQLVIVVTSAPENFEERKAIRRTWGKFNSTDPVKLVFIVGSSTPENEKKLLDENALHADIIHGHFMDSYVNLTLKTISMLEWVMSSCQKTKFILKADDDTFINVNKLLELLESRMNDRKSIYGCVRSNLSPFRDPKSKYFISYEEFTDLYFPRFTSGPAYLLTRDCAELIYDEAMDQKYLKLEDVFITGVVASRLDIQRVQLKEFLNERPKAMDACLVKETVSLHYISPREQIDLWKLLNNENIKCH